MPLKFRRNPKIDKKYTLTLDGTSEYKDEKVNNLLKQRESWNVQFILHHLSSKCEFGNSMSNSLYDIGRYYDCIFLFESTLNCQYFME